MDLSLIAQKDKIVEIGDVKVTICAVDPLLQVEIIEQLINKEIKTAKDRVMSYKFIFDEVVTNVNVKKVDYKGSEFFKTMRITEDNNIIFMNEVISEIIGHVFLTEEEEKK